jgi:hypothetical protein
VLDEIALQGSLRPVSQAAASTRWSWVIHNNTLYESYPRPACDAAQMNGTLTSASSPASKLYRSAAVLHCIILAEHTTQGRLHLDSRISSQFLCAACNSRRYRPATFLGTEASTHYATGIIGSMSP